MSEKAPVIRTDEDQQSLRFTKDSNAAHRSSEEQQRILSELDAERYDAWQGGQEDEYAAVMERHYDALEARALDDAQTRRMYILAQEVAGLRSRGSSEIGSQQIIADKEDKLNELLAQYEESIYSTYETAQANSKFAYDNAKRNRDKETALGDGVKAEDLLHKQREVIDFLVELTASPADRLRGDSAVDSTAETSSAETEAPATATERTLGETATAAAGIGSPEPVSTSATGETSSEEGSVATHEYEDTPAEGSETSVSDSETPSHSTDTPPATEANTETASETRALKAEDVDWIRTIESSTDATYEQKLGGYMALRDRLEREGYSPEEAAKMLDAARNKVKSSETEATPTTPDTDTEAAEEEADDENELPTNEELAEHDEVQEQLRQTGMHKQPSSRKQRRTLRRLRRTKARKDSLAWATAQNEVKIRSASEADRMKKEKELFKKYRKEYFSAKGVNNTLLNRMRYRFGRDVK